jgi:hypothetical protein
MNFTSQICTTREQSERLLALGIKAETADMAYEYKPKHLADTDTDKDWVIVAHSPCGTDVPAWSLDRLIEMMPSFIDIEGFAYMLKIIQGKLFSYHSNIAGNAFLYGKGNVYESAIYTIECLIKGGYFNKEYLE